ncbi:hypothetical protein PVT67_02845 [Gallaecimonas kandeliae]|uniref:hypothetical protein n=1 Tax=Gallaecimonas kandeliae TaxID=3029055 RepID=UPI0026475D83|nr:hypothetical protein [Gallaecimonas kandeliae]WKE66200.1 hypothetical protein PVT67_02845 [Gallaecimonas kandeliae]
MNVNSASSILAQQAAVQASQARDQVEGNKPDGDGDKDDGVQVSTAKPQGPLGNNIDTQA